MIPGRRGVALVALLLAGCSTEVAGVHETSVPVALATASTTTAREPTESTATSTEPSTSTATGSSVATTTAAGATNTTIARLPVPQAPPGPNAIDALVTLGTIEIPRIGLNTSLFEGITIPTFDRGPGHWPGTALPGGVGNVVVGGHRTSKARPFRHLEQLLPGDEVIFTTDSGRFVYHVVRTEIVTPGALWIINQTEAFTATLFACNPVGSTKQRIVVFLELSV